MIDDEPFELVTLIEICPEINLKIHDPKNGRL